MTEERKKEIEVFVEEMHKMISDLGLLTEEEAKYFESTYAAKCEHDQDLSVS